MNDNTPGVRRGRAYIGRNAKGFPVQQPKTIHTGAKSAKPGAGTRLADRELANMIDVLPSNASACLGRTIDFGVMDEALVDVDDRGESARLPAMWTRQNSQLFIISERWSLPLGTPPREPPGC